MIVKFFIKNSIFIVLIVLIAYKFKYCLFKIKLNKKKGKKLEFTKLYKIINS